MTTRSYRGPADSQAWLAEHSYQPVTHTAQAPHSPCIALPQGFAATSPCATACRAAPTPEHNELTASSRPTKTATVAITTNSRSESVHTALHPNRQISTLGRQYLAPRKGHYATPMGHATVTTAPLDVAVFVDTHASSATDCPAN
jgi:hypothetical protein